MEILQMIEEWEASEPTNYRNPYAIKLIESIKLIENIKRHQQKQLLHAYRAKLFRGPECFSNHVELLARIDLALNDMLDPDKVITLCKEYTK